VALGGGCLAWLKSSLPHESRLSSNTEPTNQSSRGKVVAVVAALAAVVVVVIIGVLFTTIANLQSIVSSQGLENVISLGK